VALDNIQPMIEEGLSVEIIDANAKINDALVTLADDAPYAAKAAGRNTFRIHGHSEGIAEA